MARGYQGKISRTDWIYAGLLTILAAIPRLYRLNLAEFKLDEATHYQLAYQLTHGGWQWVGSTSSVGIPKAPLFIYTLAIPMQFARDPRFVTGFLGILAAVAAGSFYLILRRYLSKKAAFIGALLFALNPQAVLYARKLFTADLLPPLCTLFLGTALGFLESNTKQAGRWATLTALTFAMLLLTTFSPILLLPAFCLLFWQRRKALHKPDWLKAALALGLPFVPYLIEIAPKIPGVLASIDTQGTETQYHLSAWIWTLLYGTGWPTKWETLAGATTLILGFLSLAGAFWLLRAAQDQKQGTWAAFILTWIVVSPLLGLIAPIDFQAHYLVILYPLIFILPAAGVELADHRAKWLGISGTLLLLTVAGWQVQTWTQTLDDIAQGVEGYGTPLGYWQRAAKKAEDLATQHEASEILLVMPGDQPWDEKAHILDTLLIDTPHRVVNGHTTLLYPSHTTLVLLASEVEEALALLDPCAQALTAPLEASPFGGTYHYYLWNGETLQQEESMPTCALEHLEPVSAQWASGTSLLGYHIAGEMQPGNQLHILLHWSTTQESLQQEVHWFNHLLDQEENTWGQFDTTAWPAKRWQLDGPIQAMTYFDIVLSPDAAAGPYTLRIGQYTYPDMQNIPVIDDAGNPAEYAANFPIKTENP